MINWFQYFIIRLLHCLNIKRAAFNQGCCTVSIRIFPALVKLLGTALLKIFLSSTQLFCELHSLNGNDKSSFQVDANYFICSYSTFQSPPRDLKWISDPPSKDSPCDAQLSSCEATAPLSTIFLFNGV